MLIKLDFSKAFDHISYQYMYHLFTAFGFIEKWIHWVLALISKVFFSILINGNPSTIFIPSRGIRQAIINKA